MPRPKVEIDEALLEALAGIGCTTQEMATICKVSKKTLERRYDATIKRGRANFHTSIRREQWKHAQKGSAALLIWLGKQNLGQKDDVTLTHSGSIGSSNARERLARRIAGITARKGTDKPAEPSDGRGSGESDL